MFYLVGIVAFYECHYFIQFIWFKNFLGRVLNLFLIIYFIFTMYVSYVVWTAVKLMILLPLLPKCCHYRCMPPNLAFLVSFFKKLMTWHGGMVASSFNPSNWESETGRSWWVQCYQVSKNFVVFLAFTVAKIFFILWESFQVSCLIIQFSGYSVIPNMFLTMSSWILSVFSSPLPCFSHK